MATKIPRSEYPRPQMQRPDWLCLNGTWQFERDPGDTGLEQGWVNKALTEKITVPFCPESELSGLGCTDYMEAVWYRRTVSIPKDWKGRRLLLHFQAVDHEATVWVNGVEVGRHKGGFTPFSCELSGVAIAGQSATLVLRARDPKRGPQARGKQSNHYENYNCLYTRTTGIWQTVWLEAVPQSYLERPRLTPDVAAGRISLVQKVNASQRGQRIHASLLSADGDTVAEAEASVDSDFAPQLSLDIPVREQRLWSPEDPHLYGLQIELRDADGRLVDKVSSYTALRGVRIQGKAVLLNGKTVFQRLVLDQGLYPDGLMTAPSDQALIQDIVLAQKAGFNGARLHQKVFEERFLYHADRLGYLCWGEFADWGAKPEWPEAGGIQEPTASFITQWLEAVERDYSHPCIIGWCPMNETSERMSDRLGPLDDVMRGMFLATKAFDPTRPVLDTSGYAHRVVETDIYDSHQYEQDPRKFKALFKGLAEDKPFINGGTWDPVKSSRIASGNESVPYRGQPYFCSEFGGIWWAPKAKRGEDSWGYGQRPKSIAEVYRRFEGLCDALLQDPNMFGYCYTQLTDVFQEQNGIYDFKRRPKFDMARIRAVQVKAAAIEKKER